MPAQMFRSKLNYLKTNKQIYLFIFFMYKSVSCTIKIICHRHDQVCHLEEGRYHFFDRGITSKS